MRTSLTGNRGWIESPRYDLALLGLSPLFGIGICAFAFAMDSAVLSAISLFAIGMPHYLSTYTFFLDDENDSYVRSRKVAFFVGPLLVVGLLTASLALHFYMLVAAVVDVWNVFHVSRQSIGILSIYRHLGGGDNRAEKLPANFALLGIGAGLYFVHIADQPSVSYYLAFLPFDAAPYLGPLFLAGGLAALVFLLLSMGKRRIRAARSELIFLGSSLFLFAPYILIDSRSTASSAMLAGHYVQYLGLLWLFHHRKFASGTGSAKQKILSRISRSWVAIVAFLALLVGLTVGVDRVVHHFDARAFHTWLLNVVVLLHFYYDGLFWSFKQPQVRQSIGPHLILPDRRLMVA